MEKALWRIGWERKVRIIESGARKPSGRSHRRISTRQSCRKGRDHDDATSLRERYDAGNAEAAAIIWKDPVQFPPGSGAQQWTETFMRRLERPRERSIGPLCAAEVE